VQPVLDRAFLKLGGWQADLLNMGGRRELIKTVLGLLPTYLLTVIKPPKKFYKEIDKLCCCDKGGTISIHTGELDGLEREERQDFSGSRKRPRSDGGNDQVRSEAMDKGWE
jgi:hypothetical protein